MFLLRPLSSLTDHRQQPGAEGASPERHTSVTDVSGRKGGIFVSKKKKTAKMQKLLPRPGRGVEERSWRKQQGGGSGQRASSYQLGRLRLSYWHAGAGTRSCPETAVNQQPIAQQSGAGFLGRMLMCCNLLLSASCSQLLHPSLCQSDSPGISSS